MRNDLIKVLIDDLDEEILDRMPEWFKILRDELKRKTR